MAAYRSIDFWAPSLHPNTIEDIALPEPGPSRDPIVRHLPIKYAEHASVGVIKRMAMVGDELLVADDQYRISSLALPDPAEPTSVPIVTSQTTIPVPKAGSQWTGLTALAEGGAAISSLASGRVTLHTTGAAVAGTLKVGRPVLTLCAPDSGRTFALAGKEVEVGIWDAERAFASTSTDSAKRKKDTASNSDALAPGEVWRAKNLPHNQLRLRQPVHHLCSTFLRGSTTQIVTGTKAGNVRRYDTRQRKPTADWKVAREGGVGSVLHSATNEHELFFADHSSLTAALDLRTGRMLYVVQGVAASAAFMGAVPAPEGKAFTKTAGLATLSSDATLRVIGTMPPVGEKKGSGNSSATAGKKGGVLASAGGMGVGSFVFRGFGAHRDVVPPKAEGEEGEEGEEEEEEVDEEEMWEGMGEVDNFSDDGEESEDEGSGDEEMVSDGEEESESEEEEVAPAKKKGRK